MQIKSFICFVFCVLSVAIRFIKIEWYESLKGYSQKKKMIMYYDILLLWQKKSIF